MIVQSDISVFFGSFPSSDWPKRDNFFAGTILSSLRLLFNNYSPNEHFNKQNVSFWFKFAFQSFDLYINQQSHRKS